MALPQGRRGRASAGGRNGRGWVQRRRVDGGGTKRFGEAALSCPQEPRVGNASEQKKSMWNKNS